MKLLLKKKWSHFWKFLLYTFFEVQSLLKKVHNRNF